MRAIYFRHDGAATASVLEPPGRREDEPAILTEIAVWPEHRGKGWGSEILKEVCRAADAEGITLILSVDPAPGGLSDEELAAWYGRYGFQRSEDDEEVMIRLAQSSATRYTETSPV
ncbi:GNAT family N-acetyltransferase [Streptomyces sp. SID14515]|uniref:GNAT family N-acetyltransferase n=1 Tax=Streptomyces sp. SID14515 TaxID=2706074 RepID=UPI0013C6061B|nr:GNAT family N-acetyltransferase [Streptomyces sp. SID14515]NEB42542.1 GNAT family N-acetyltransferase [Streptomyces sp. SID14515]